jgi:glycosyl hydrolase family 9
MARFFRCLAVMLTLSLSACLSKPTTVPLVRLDDSHLQLRRVSQERPTRLVEPRLFINSEKRSLRSVSYARHLESFNPKNSISSFVDVHTFEVAEPLKVGERVEIQTESKSIHGEIVSPDIHPGIHVDRIGYQKGRPGTVKLGLYLGEKELPLPGTDLVRLQHLDEPSTTQDLSWKKRKESGYPFEPNPNQEVAEVVLPSLPEGKYQLEVPGWGASRPFRVSDSAALESARTYAQGMYHQRCGAELLEPYTKWVRPACHQTAVSGAEKPILGGHHDAGDYGRYTHNSALTAHTLLFAADHWFDRDKPDNLGLPESGDGVSDLHQVALIELDFLIQMQRPDGLFWGRVSPKDRAYESDVTADRAGPQRVRDGSSAASAAAVAVLFQAARSDYLKKKWPKKAEVYREAAEKGWESLPEQTFQKADHHYGDVFEDADERLWAATERAVSRSTEPPRTPNQELRRWGWWPAFEGYGGAARAVAFAPSGSGKLVKELDAAAKVWLEAYNASAYGVTFPLASKHHQSAGWFFPHDYSFDLVTSNLLDPDPRKIDAVWSNWHYERGLNPLDQVFLTGYGELSPRYILHQQAINDAFDLPPAGIPVGSIVTNIRFANVPQNVDAPPFEPGPDGKPLDQRFSDSPNVLSEATVLNQARGLVVCAWLAREALSPAPASPARQEPR